MTNSARLSVTLAVYNESNNLAACLDSVREIADEIIVVDGTSSDNTVDIAKSYGARVTVVPNDQNFHKNKQLANDQAQFEWVLQLDADERLTQALRQEIKALLNSPASSAYAAYYLKRRNYFLGRWLNKGGAYPDPVIRLFQRGKAHLPAASVHELMQVDGATAYLNNDLLHLADPTFFRYLKRSNRYTSLQAEAWLNQTDPLDISWRGVVWHCLVTPFWRFLLIYFRHKGCQDGFPGFVFAFYSGLHLVSSYVKYYELRQSPRSGLPTQDWE